MNLRIKKNSLGIKTLAYLISFTIFILLMLWIIQSGFLKIFYEKYRISSINSVATKIANNYNGEVSVDLESIAYDADICIELYIGAESYAYNIMNKDCVLRNRDIAINTAKNKLYYSSNVKNYITIENPINKSKTLIYGLRLDANTYVFLNTKLEDVNSTSSLLMSQLIYITLIVIILSVIMSIFVSKMLNKPIYRITTKARRMAEGDYTPDKEDYGIAEINELNNVLNYARSEIRNTDELRRDLMANVSHDLKTPLTMIKAYAEMARDINNDNEEKRAENLEIIIAEADRLNVLVNDILDLSKLQSGSAELKTEDYDLINELNEILKRYQIIKETENYKFILDIPSIAVVNADKKKINQVLYNLINNAINYTGKDLKVIINLKETKNFFLVEIVDTGKGISKVDLSLIWSKYYKKEKNHKRNVVGTGLGLSIVKNILTDHKFDFGVESQKGKGTKFYFYIKKSKIS